MIKIFGKTYHHRNLIKSLGYRWNADEKCWQSNDATTLAALENIKGLIVEQDGKEILDSRSHKEIYGQCEDAPCCGCCGVHPYYSGNEYYT